MTCIACKPVCRTTSEDRLLIRPEAEVPDSIESSMRFKHTSLLLTLSLVLLQAGSWPAPAQRGRIERGQMTSAGLTNNPFGDTAPIGDRCLGPQQLKPTLEKQNKLRSL